MSHASRETFVPFIVYMAAESRLSARARHPFVHLAACSERCLALVCEAELRVFGQDRKYSMRVYMQHIEYVPGHNLLSSHSSLALLRD